MYDRIYEHVKRLTRCGFSSQFARQICERRAKDKGPDSVESYVRFVENLMNDAREYPREVW